LISLELSRRKRKGNEPGEDGGTGAGVSVGVELLARLADTG
jgi:hypothetical protein